MKNKKQRKLKCVKCGKIIKHKVPRLLCDECYDKYSYGNAKQKEDNLSAYLDLSYEDDIDDAENFFLFSVGFFDGFFESL